ncbi:phosphoglycolate phosphatase [Halobacteriales archaeon QS_1_68_20]|nr:MAG: phosphoglycolate phosphatase [Halobacteriales archaeon QS_1_68_20]
MDAPPLVVDVDGTLTRPDAGARARSVDPRAMDALYEWPGTVVVATGKAFPYPVGLCGFVGIPETVVAENGGVVLAEETVRYAGDPEAARAVAADYEDAGYDLGWGPADTVNRWRETEVAVSHDAPEEPLREIAAEHGMTVVDTGYAYHVVSPDVDKAAGLREVADLLGLDPRSFVAVGDSENDAPTFGVAGRSFAVANADETARNAADEVTEGVHADGLLEALELVRQEDI